MDGHVGAIYWSKIYGRPFTSAKRFHVSVFTGSSQNLLLAPLGKFKADCKVSKYITADNTSDNTN